jgi:hypothetical protein
MVLPLSHFQVSELEVYALSQKFSTCKLGFSGSNSIFVIIFTMQLIGPILRTQRYFHDLKKLRLQLASKYYISKTNLKMQDTTF